MSIIHRALIKFQLYQKSHDQPPLSLKVISLLFSELRSCFFISENHHHTFALFHPVAPLANRHTDFDPNHTETCVCVFVCGDRIVELVEKFQKCDIWNMINSWQGLKVMRVGRATYIRIITSEDDLLIDLLSQSDLRKARLDSWCRKNPYIYICSQFQITFATLHFISCCLSDMHSLYPLIVQFFFQFTKCTFYVTETFN